MSEQITLVELFEIYARKRLKAGSKHTTRLYLFSIKNLGKSIGKETPTLEDFTDDNIDRHMWRLVGEGQSPASANKDCAQLTAMWRFANKNRMVETWPNIRLLPMPERVPLAWMPDEIRKILAAIETLPPTKRVCNIPARIWWQALIQTLLDTGERIGAVMGVQRSHIMGEYLLFPAEVRKGRKRERMYKLSDVTQKLLAKMGEYSNQDKLFPWDRCATYIYNVYKEILKRAGLDYSARSQFHKLRRTVCSAVANQGGDPTAALDHANPRTTRAYLDPRVVDDEPTVDLVRAWLNGEDKKPRDYRRK